MMFNGGGDGQVLNYTFGTANECFDYLKTINKYIFDGFGCNGTYDKIKLCWPAVPANTTTYMKCPAMKDLFDPSKTTFKYCTAEGHWDGYNKSINGSESGVNNVVECLDEVARQAYDITKNIKNQVGIVNVNKGIELSGLILSIICIGISLFVFLYHEALRCRRIRIHINLFIAILLQIVIRLIISIDQMAYRKDGSVQSFHLSVKITGLCQSFYILLNYTLTCVFSWMLIEGIYLNILLTYSIFDDNKHKLMVFFYLIGWVFPFLLTIAWASVMAVNLGFNPMCWAKYTKMGSYWIVHGPRLSIILINVICLINVIRILNSKLRENKTNELEQIKKSARAAILLLPLLGMTHIFFFIDPPAFSSVSYASYMWISTFLISYQGVFVSILYCFLNNEVKNVIKRHWFGNLRFGSKFFNRRQRKGNDGGDGGDQRREQQNLMGSEIPMSEMTTTMTKTQMFSVSESEQV